MAPQRGRPAMVGVGLVVVLTIAAAVSGFTRPHLPREWDHDRLIVDKTTGARYVGVEGTLHPIDNATSARLLLPVGYQVVVVDDEDLASRPHGPALGIVGAPDFLPRPSDLAGTEWTACAEGPEKSEVRVGSRPGVKEAPSRTALLVDTGAGLALVTGGQRYPIGNTVRDVTLRALDLDGTTISRVSPQWVRLFPEGSPLAPPSVPHAGDALPTGLRWPPAITRVGTIVEVVDITGDTRRYVAVRDGLAPISDVVAALLQATTDATRKPVRVSPATLAALPTAARPVAPADWPVHLLTPLDYPTPCAVLHAGAGTKPRIALGGLDPSSRVSAVDADSGTDAHSGISADSATDADSGISADRGTSSEPAFSGHEGANSNSDASVGPGALARVISTPPERPGRVVLVDAAGETHELVGDLSDLLARLGYRGVDPVPVPGPWVDALAEGVAFSTSAARAGLRG